MKAKYWALSAISLLVVLAAIPCATAGTVDVGDYLQVFGAAGSSNAGEFIITDTDLIDPFASFNTFCLEANEPLSFGVTYYVYDISNSADLGGLGGGSPDPISWQTDYLYYLFRTNQIPLYTHTAEQQYALSRVFWFLENEIGAVSGALQNTYLALANSGDSTMQYGSEVINIGTVPLATTGQLLRRQSFLNWNPVTIPEPTSLLLLGLGLCSVGIIARKKSR